MKSQTNQLGKSYLTVSKGLIITLALFGLNQMGASTFRTTDNSQGDSFKSDSLASKKQFSPVEDQAIFNPSLMFTEVKERSIEHVIAEGNQITESSQTHDHSLLFIEKSVEDIIRTDNEIIEASKPEQIRPLYLDRTMEDKIAEDNAIIENEGAEVFMLDIDIIKKKQINLKKRNALLIGMN